MEEIWKYVKGFNSGYMVSNTGKVRGKNGKELSQANNNGYRRVLLHRNGERVNMFVHRLVGMAFIPNPENKPQINHRDGNKSNNLAGNLEWCTESENKIHAIKNGLCGIVKSKTGEAHPRAKLTEKDVKYIRMACNSGLKTQAELAREFNTPNQNISWICNGGGWKHVK